MTTTWQGLTHDSVLNSVEQTLGVKLSNLLLERNSYINRVYELEEYDSLKRFIVKFYRPNRWTKEMVLEEHQFLAELADKEIPVIPPLSFNNTTLFAADKIYYAIFPKKGGRSLDEFDQDNWQELGRLLGRVHLVGATHQSSARVIWRPTTATENHLKILMGSDYVLEEFKKSLRQTIELFIQKAEVLFNNQEFILLHGDCHKSNLISRPNESIYIIDFDDMSFGPAVQDIWMLLPDKPEDCEKELAWFLKGYETFREFDRATLDLVPALRGMRLIHYAAWLASQSKEMNFKKHFPQAGTKRYWNELIKDIQQIVYKELYPAA